MSAQLSHDPWSHDPDRTTRHWAPTVLEQSRGTAHPEAQHPTFPVGTRVRHRGYANVRGVVTASTFTSVWTRWDDGLSTHFDGWQAGNNLRRIESDRNL